MSLTHPKLLLLALNLGVILVLDVCAGTWTRVDPVSDYRRPHPAYHHDLRPSVRAVARWGPRRYEIATNSLGFRDASVRDVPLARAGRRVLLMGDSFTEGVGVAWEESFAGRLAQAAAGEAEVLNGGVIGYSPKVYRAKTAYLVEHLGLELSEVVVFLDMSDVPNEILYDVWQPDPDGAADESSPGVGAWLRRHSLLLRSLERLREAPAEVAWNTQGMPFADDLQAPALRDPAFYDEGHWDESYPYAKRGLQLAWAHMDALARLCEQRGLTLTLVVHPWPSNIRAGEVDHLFARVWRQFAERRGLVLVDLFPLFIDGEADADATLAHYFIDGDVHWNAEGHRLVAFEVAKKLGLSGD